MTARTKQRLLGVAFGLWICYTVFLSIVQISENRTIDRYHLDLVFHITAYLVMVVLGAALIRWFVLIPALGIAAGTELAQALLPWRSGNWGDLGIDLVGILVGMAIWILARRLRRTAVRSQGTG